MAEIRDQLTLVDRFSNTLNRYATKMSASAKMTRSAERQVTAANTSMAGTTSAAMVAAAESTVNSTVEISGATQNLIDRLASAQDALAQSFTSTQAEQNLASLERQMKRVGLVWTSTAAEEESAILLARDSLSDLARQGLITANTIARGAYQEMQARQQAAAAAAAEKAAARQAAEDKKAFAEAEKLTAWLVKETAAAQREEAVAARASSAAHQGIIGRLAQHTQGLIKNAIASAKARQAHDALGNKLMRMGALLFTARRIMRFLADTIERAPNGIQKSWSTMTNGLRDTLARGFVSMLKAMQPAMDRFNKFMSSPAGQRMARGLQTAMSLLGQVVGVVLDKITALGEWVGNNFTTVMEVAGVLALVYAKNMLAAAAATAIANLPLLLTIGLVSAAIVGLQKAGFTAQDIFTGIGQAAGTLYAFVYNLVAMGYNMFASAANFVGNVFKDPVASVKILFLDMAITVLGHIQKMAQGIEDLINKIPGVSVNLTSGIDALYNAATNKRDQIKADSGWTQYVDPMSYKDYGTTANAWGDKFGSFADKFTNFSLDHTTAAALKNIDKNTSAISKNLSDEDLKYLEDVAIRKYERNSSVTLAPQIKVMMQGNADKSAGYDVANAIADILARQAASHTSLTT
ncbi:hypothetical protein [Oscillibacter sp.]|uniref:hypothetical protein n=1 Tax=Oscillibacter sp. TaxID=1945593 RepID=UPI00289895B6|nr:hypothetical protein [Oscillibacter sp.]